MRLLLHACCAPCSVMSVESLKGEGISPALLWYNPNIHPFTEYENRRKALVAYAEGLNISLILKDGYGLRDFVAALKAPYDDRCGYCYRVRMEETAKEAQKEGFDAFSTTLLISPYQDHELIRAEAERAAKLFSVSFLYRDFRPGFREGQTRARDMGLYMQKYCGCIFSEEERYKKKIDALSPQ